MKIVYDDGLVRIAVVKGQYSKTELVLFQCIQDAFGNKSWNRVVTFATNGSIHLDTGFEKFLDALPEVVKK